ncbi:MAG: hypothetical protein A3B81_02000 [Candidatus Muproteobacteria bacterium RIFCSPHIGHO2_02_FULL_65_16]|uniref:Uncharacterized protein n=1 Tax=Candidatus Muproteobacteria bacterium RIFCSPHIGHO2_02_FULL_65_16 TaxID=1817766 RepID=A0A1F6U3G2_9PROT|nr:MAG: hypothetical protein A3B81_02000 [Candidatus Muproteobacteria bacterium RIFCSPHIGHO2_02_FULL_65_16]
MPILNVKCTHLVGKADMTQGKVNERVILERLRGLPENKAKEVEDLIGLMWAHREWDTRAMETAYREMAADGAREREALLWSEAHVDDGLEEMPGEKRENWR